MMRFFDLYGRSHEQDMKQLEAIHDALNASPEVDVFPLKRIPVECEDAPVHDGTWPCGDPDCPCAIYGYGVPSLD
jgi:hypothetical protein